MYKLKKLIKLWKDAHNINYLQCDCNNHSYDLSQEHFKIVCAFNLEGEQKWIAIHNSMIHGNWKTEHKSYEQAYVSLLDHIREQIEEEIFIFNNNHEHCECKGFMFSARQLALMNQIHKQLGEI
jgi:hypothetical protein